MAHPAVKNAAPWAADRSRALDIDRDVGARIRERRIILGLTAQQMAELIGVTYSQAIKYEKGVNRIAAGRLFSIAEALGVDIGYFFEGRRGADQGFKPTPQQRMLLELARNFVSIPTRKHQERIAVLTAAVSTIDDPHIPTDERRRSLTVLASNAIRI